MPPAAGFWNPNLCNAFIYFYPIYTTIQTSYVIFPLLILYVLIKVSARVKKAKILNFWFRDVQIKPFKSFLKKSRKKYYFSAKLLDVDAYYT